MTIRNSWALVLAALSTLGACSAAHAATYYAQPGIERRTYTKALIEDLQLRYDDASPIKDFDSEQAQRLRAAALEELRATIAERFEVVTVAGPGVIRVRAAITGIRAEEKRKRFWQYTPVGLIKTRVDAASGANVALRAATVELEIVDAASGERLGGAIVPDEDASWRRVIATVGAWAHVVIDKIDSTAKAA
jgi:hypothetical protein